MSIESEILRIQHNIADAYTKVSEKGGNVPLQPNSTNLAESVASIPTITTVLVNAPIGSILTWSGTADTVPEGWHICNGEDGTLDLRDKFVLGSGPNHAVGETGGSEEVTLTVEQMPRHSHNVIIHGSALEFPENHIKIGISALQNGTGYTYAELTENTGGSQPHPNMPPYYTLLYIQKTSATPSDYVTETEMNAAIQTAISNIPAGSNVPTGGIIIWSGVSTAVPSGWALCDGTNGTPDLRGRFVLGESADHAHGETGGSEEVVLTVDQMPKHNHSYYYRSGVGTADGSGRSYATDSRSSLSSSSTGGDQPHQNMPPYYVLAYIMKL